MSHLHDPLDVDQLRALDQYQHDQSRLIRGLMLGLPLSMSLWVAGFLAVAWVRGVL